MISSNFLFHVRSIAIKLSIAKKQKFMQDECGRRQGLKSSQYSDQFTEETIRRISREPMTLRVSYSKF